MRRQFVSFLFFLTTFCGLNSAHADRAADLVKQMTLEEKISLIGGDLFATKPLPRLGIPALKMTDGPIGVRWNYSTAFPSGISMGASFNRELVYKTVSAMAMETRAHGRDMLLGPCVGISRVPFGGRNFEGMGEDPFLTSEIVAYYVRALNDQKVVGSVKHFGLNDQEYRRMDINSVADERTMQEIHFVAFERAVNEGIGTVMASYNKLNGAYASENAPLLTGILKQKWGFKGVVVSDWGATHSVVPAALAGLDLEMPYGDNFGPELLKAVKQEEVPESLIDDKVTRLIGVIEKVGLLDGAGQNRPPETVINSPQHQQLALEMARESHVLLKNQGLLPLDAKKLKSVAVIGPNADVYVNGGGSSAVETARKISTLTGLRSHLPASVKVEFSAGSHSPGTKVTPAHMTTPDGRNQGLLGEYFDNAELKGKPVFSRVDQTVDFFWDNNQSPSGQIAKTHEYSVRWTGVLRPKVTGDYVLNTLSDDGVRLYIDGKAVINNWTNHGTTENTKKIHFVKGQAYKIRLEYYQGWGSAIVRFGWTPPADALLKDAVELASKSDVAVVQVGYNAASEGEAQDREGGFDLPKEQVDLIQAVTAANANTIVVINSGNPVAMGGWISPVKAVIYAWFAGQEAGNALADILLGNYNPSGRLPVTLLKRWEDSPAYGTYPEKNGETIYQEGVFVGYRHFDKAGIAPEYPFGYGLSYTSFLYSDLKIKTDSLVAANPDVTVTATVTNKGARAGSEVVQLYVADLEPKIDRPVQELKGFEKIFLQPGESKEVSFRLNRRSFAYYDVTTHDWMVQPGRFNLRVASSSRDLRLNGDITLTGP